MRIYKTIGAVMLAGLVFGLAGNGHSQTFLTNGLVAYFPFSGNANDATGNGHHGTNYGAVLTANRFGIANDAYAFDGASSYLAIPLGSSEFTNDFTASVWFQVNNLSNPWPAILYEDNQSFLIQYAGDKCGCGGPGNLVSYSAYPGPTFNWFLQQSQRPATNTYYQVTITKAGNNVTMYLNAQAAASAQASASPVFVAGQTLYVGRAPTTEGIAGNTTFNGVIDDVRIYNRALSASEVGQLYAMESAPILNVRKAIYFDSPNLLTNAYYQVQVSTNLNTWTDYGDPFMPTNSNWRSPYYIDVDNWNKFFFQLKMVAP